MSVALISQPTDQGPEALHNFTETIVHSIALTSGKWVVFGKVVVANSDGDAQNVSVKLRSHQSTVLDKVDLRIPGGSVGQSISLEAALTAPDATIIRIDITCSTFAGQAYEAQLIAISVDQLENITVPL